jgi:predicted enzyme related to lactoylglutathione lyase
MILGLRTVIYPVRDMADGKACYSRVLDRQPYFDEPYYIGFSVGGFELGLIPDGVPSASGAHAFWGVPKAEAEIERLTGMGAAIHEPVKEVGGGIEVATVIDPFGNVIGIIENPYFDPKTVQ